MEALSLTAILVAVSAAIGGGVVAAFITSIIAPRVNEYFGLRLERRKLLNSALHRLLGLYAVVRLRDVKAYLDKIRHSWVQGLILEGFSEEEINELFARVIEARPPTTAESISHIDFLSRSEKQLHLLISDIAPFDPILAFKISRRHTRIGTTLEENPESDPVKALDALMWLNQRRRLEKDLRVLSRRLGLRSYVKLRWELWRWAKESKEDGDRIISELFSQDLKPKLVDLLTAMRNAKANR